MLVPGLIILAFVIFLAIEVFGWGMLIEQMIKKAFSKIRGYLDRKNDKEDK